MTTREAEGFSILGGCSMPMTRRRRTELQATEMMAQARRQAFVPLAFFCRAWTEANQRNGGSFMERRKMVLPGGGR